MRNLLYIYPKEISKIHSTVFWLLREVVEAVALSSLLACLVHVHSCSYIKTA